MSEVQDITFYRYPPRSLVGDYLRSAGGVALGVFALMAAGASTWVVAIFGSVTAIFGYFGFRTMERQLLEVAVTPEGIYTTVSYTHLTLPTIYSV